MNNQDSDATTGCGGSGPANPSLSGPQPGVIYYIDDHLGSSHLVTDSMGNVLREESRYPYGLERNVSDNTVVADYVYTGKEYDAETGLIYFGGRYYAPELGRWISPDPLFLEKEPAKIIEMPKELNLYAYVQGNPMSAVDRDGEATDFNIGQKPTYIPGRPWSERSPEQRMVETVAMGVVGTVAIAPIAVVAGLAAAPIAGKAVAAAGLKAFAAKTAVYAAVSAEVGYMANAAKDFVLQNAAQLVQVYNTAATAVTGYASPDMPENMARGIGAAINYGFMIDDRYKFSDQLEAAFTQSENELFDQGMDVSTYEE